MSSFVNKEDLDKMFSDAVKFGLFDMAKFLLDNGADVNAADKSTGMTHLLTASMANNVPLVKLLLKNGADAGKANKNGESPLIIACIQGNDSIVNLLLDAGADVNENANNIGDTPLILASFNNQVPVVELLLSRGANVNKQLENGNTALLTASSVGNTEVVKVLLKYGADANIANNGEMPVDVARANGHDDIAELILSHYNDLYEQALYPGADALNHPTGALGDLHNEADNRSKVLSLLHTLFETRGLNLTDEEGYDMLTELMTLEGLNGPSKGGKKRRRTRRESKKGKKSKKRR
jgi:ankyrin repeat protein